MSADCVDVEAVAAHGEVCMVICDYYGIMARRDNMMQLWWFLIFFVLDQIVWQECYATSPGLSLSQSRRISRVSALESQSKDWQIAFVA